MGHALRLWGPVAAWMAVIFAVSSRSVPAGIGVFPDWTTHGAAYLILSVLVCRALSGGFGKVLKRNDALVAILLSTAYGISDEMHQRFVPGRQGEAVDVAKDLAGVLVGAWLYRRASVPRADIAGRETQRG